VPQICCGVCGHTAITQQQQTKTKNKKEKRKKESIN
jgi:hypothetical protein